MKDSLRRKRHKVLRDLGLSFSSYESTIDGLCDEVVRLQQELTDEQGSSFRFRARVERFRGILGDLLEESRA